MTESGLRHKKNNGGQSTKTIKLVALNAKFIHSCMALFYIRNELEKHMPEMDIEILQLTINDNLYESLLRITEGNPYGVFFSAAIWNSDRVEQLVEDVRNCLPDCQIVVGGPQAGELRKSIAHDLCSVVVGEIEAIEPVFYDDLRRKKLKELYIGSFLKQHSKKLDYPYNNDDFSGPLKNRHIYYESSRGCPYSCTYCLSSAEKGLFHKDIEQVKEEITQILKFKPKVVRFVDRTFNDVSVRSMEIWKFILEQESDTLFHFEIAPDRFTEEMFSLLEKVKPGQFQLEIGIQSTNDKTLTAIQRRIDKEKIHPIINRLAKLNTIHLHVDLILGLPYETEETFRQSFEDVFAMGAHYIQMGLLKILPDTLISSSVEEYGYLHNRSVPYSIYSNRWINHQGMSDLYWFCETVEKFYNNRYFVSLWQYLRKRCEPMFPFFTSLIEEGQKRDFLHRATTQELLCSIVVDVCSKRNDLELILDLLRYDWLRCGYRKLPDFLETEDELGLSGCKDYLYGLLPDQIDGLYNVRSRNQFFRRSVFLGISKQAAEELEMEPTGEYVRLAFLQEREPTVYAHNQVRVLSTSQYGDTI